MENRDTKRYINAIIEDSKVKNLSRYLSVDTLPDTAEDIVPERVNEDRQSSVRTFSESDSSSGGSAVGEWSSTDDDMDHGDYDEPLNDIIDSFAATNDVSNLKNEFRQTRVSYNHVSTSDMVRLITRSLISHFSHNMETKSKPLLEIFPDLIQVEEDCATLVLEGIAEITRLPDAVLAEKTMLKTSTEAISKAAVAFFRLYAIFDDHEDLVLNWWETQPQLHDDAGWKKLIDQVRESSESADDSDDDTESMSDSDDESDDSDSESS